MSWHYYEAHVTVEPVEGLGLVGLETLCSEHAFRVSDIERTAEGHVRDVFLNGRHSDLQCMIENMTMLLAALVRHGVKVKRYKIEYTLFDSRHDDALFRL